jgi:poly-D-alanine transfer protein DltD
MSEEVLDKKEDHVEETTEAYNGDSIATGDQLDDAIGTAKLKDYFNIEGSLDAVKQNRLNFLIGWAHKNGCKTNADMLAALRSVEFRLGDPNFGESREARLFRYLRLQSQQQDILKEMAVYESKSRR